MNTTGLKVRLPRAMAEAVRVLSGERHQSMNDYVKRSIRNQLMADATAMESGSLMALIIQANVPLTRAANFGSVHAAAVLALLRELARETYVRRDGLSDELACAKAQVMAEAALSEALSAFEDPHALHQFAWITRPDPDDLPDFEDLDRAGEEQGSG